jgi:hypothetical protein
MFHFRININIVCKSSVIEATEAPLEKQDMVLGHLGPLSGLSYTATISPQPGPNVIKLFYGHNLEIFVITFSVCQWQSFSA